MSSPPRQPRRDQVPVDEREAYDAVIARVRARFGHPAGPPQEDFDAGPYFGPMLTSPPLCHAASQMGAFLVARGEQTGSYSHLDREFAWQVLCAKLKTNGGQSVHIVDAVRAGVRIDAIAALRSGRDDELSEEERLVAAYARQAVDGQVSDQTYGSMESLLGTRGLFEYTALILWLHWSMRMEQWVKLPSLTDREVDELISSLSEQGRNQGAVGSRQVQFTRAGLTTGRPPQQPRREDVAIDERDAYDAVITRVRKRLGQPDGAAEGYFDAGPYFGVMLTSPPLCHLASQMGAFLVTRGDHPGSYSHADREFAEQVLCATWRTNAGQNVHIADAVRTGVRLEAIEALRSGQEQKLSDDERLVTRYVRQVVNGEVDDETYGAMEDRLKTRGLFEYTGFILWLHWTIRMEQWVKLPMASDAQLDELIAELRAGGAQDKHFTMRIA